MTSQHHAPDQKGEGGLLDLGQDGGGDIDERVHAGILLIGCHRLVPQLAWSKKYIVISFMFVFVNV
jgi:hypothetical protein